MSGAPRLKKAKEDCMEEEMGSEVGVGSSSSPPPSEQEEALVALIEHRTKEVDHLRTRLSYYRSQLEQAEKRLQDSHCRLARIRPQSNDKLSNISMGGATKEVTVERRSVSPGHTNEDSSPYRAQSKRKLVSSNLDSKPTQVTRLAESGTRPVVNSDSVLRAKRDNSNGISSRLDETISQVAGSKRKIERKEHKELVSLVRRQSSPCMIRCNASSHISGQHKRKLKNIILNPINDTLFATSALDGVVKLWQLQAKGSSANPLCEMECLSPKQRRWPEDIAWHPGGSSLLAVYSADNGDNQISVLDLNKSKAKDRVTFLEEKPHVKGNVNSIEFMPWDDACFATGGSDHAVILWKEKDKKNAWKPKALHRNLHTAAVMGVSGMRHKQMVITAGVDKRIVGFDLLAGRADYKYQIESKCMGVLPNPCDFHLFMVLTGTPERQLRLYDIRLRQTEIHAFGWKQESSEEQSALINQSWSPDGLYISSGSVDPMIHIFDIRYNAHKPSQSVQAHQKRVFKAEWHYSIPLLISISSDLNIGLHKIS